VARWAFVIPAQAGIHTPRPLDGTLTAETFFKQQMTGIMDPGLRRDDRNDHTAILRCRTGAPTVRLSAASMMALASMP
jgi:hypothetical protein